MCIYCIFKTDVLKQSMQKGECFMPPKAKFSKEEIINAGVNVLREQGLSAVTAREIGKYLNSSSRPIFTVFSSMTEVMWEIEEYARKIYTQYINAGLKSDIAFKGVGQAYIEFAQKEPKLFQLLFMKELSKDMGINKILPHIDNNYEIILKSITDNYNVTKDNAIKLYKHLWIYSHGIATLCATSMCKFSPEEIGIMLTEVFVSLLKNIIGGNKK